MNLKVPKHCVIPAGGVGTRWAPVTNYIPKIMIPLYDRPTVDWIIQEAIESGCSDIILVVDKGKSVIRNHISKNKKLQKYAKFHFLYQKRIRGIAEVMYMAKRIVGNNYFSMIISDHTCFYKSPPLLEMAKKLRGNDDIASFLGFAEYPKYNNQYYGECLLEKRGSLFHIKHLCPRYKNPNRVHHKGKKLRIAGRYIINPTLFPVLKECLDTTKKGDLSDWDVFKLAKKKGMIYGGIEIKSHFLDMGTPETYAQATHFLLTKGKKLYDSKKLI